MSASFSVALLEAALMQAVIEAPIPVRVEIVGDNQVLLTTGRNHALGVWSVADNLFTYTPAASREVKYVVNSVALAVTMTTKIVKAEQLNRDRVLKGTS